MHAGPQQSTEDLIEDIEFMLSTGSGLQEILRRTNRTENTLERILIRHDRHDLISQARARDARGAFQ